MATEMQPANPAVWCDQHQRWECTKSRKASRGGGRCHQPAIRHFSRCKLHIGIALDTALAQSQAMDAWSAVSGDINLSPADAVIGMYKLAWVRAHFYASLLEEQVMRAQEDDEDADGYNPFGRGAPPVGEGAGLIGHTYSADKEHGIFASGEQIRGLVQLEAQERDRCVRYAKVAHDMGIAEREIRIAEQQGQLLAMAVKKILDGLNLTAEQRRLVPQLVPPILRAVAAGDTAA